MSRPATNATASAVPAGPAPLVETGSGPRLLDVRTPAESGTAHIPGAYDVPLDLLREHRDELLTHLDEDVVLVWKSTNVCATGRVLSGLPHNRGPASCDIRTAVAQLSGAGAERAA